MTHEIFALEHIHDLQGVARRAAEVLEHLSSAKHHLADLKPWVWASRAA
ncbi:hypothetical protein MA5S0422_5334 [Mycobacteroides abscessus 5S-0422]|uniref:Uncharacterized protein n=1 Tax=Mycobacteroides abscessus subsp. bolletii 1513 TaxID=1299321 RepID=X8DE17_9MYCO|nr:hypothetical protein MMAS_46000 [Mycobacteroides abscessus subsp. massiliense CCUG 48898 = JCM 15300]EIU05359.1 hypothetical protein MA5S0422_5334 [Mycobacteroides abscessus 5S-0422]EIU20371.1 hypothetical protein MA5S0708_4087 [Mycobacteroides abscessus 5S-0708]EIU28689.1 hypothetical protein MA5S1212_3844 [Mycobacteroides abscessus 5S-1212]EUA66842.1 hypothetical protein I540_5560 [Mycobacteroides abscessus subsp. bolletii 1513]SIA79365.1 Uncharacterised protein [Mycobacteroides abscessus